MLNKAYSEMRRFKEDLEKKASDIIWDARAEGKGIVVLAGRPYHVDPEIGHGIDKLAASLGFVVVSDDSV